MTARRLPRRSPLFVSLVLAACPQQGELGVYTDTDPPPPGSGTDPGDTAGTGAPDSVGEPTETTAPEGPPASTGEPVDDTTTTTTGEDDTTTGEPVDDTTTTTTGEGDTTTGAPVDCAPAEPGFDHSAAVIFEPWPDIVGNEQSFAGDCTLIEVVQDVSFQIVLDCGDREATLDVRVEPAEFALGLAPGQSLELRWLARGGSWWTNQWFTLRDLAVEPSLLLAGLESDAVEPQGLPDFFAPLSLAYSGGSCGPPTDCHDPFERLVVEFTHGETVPIADATRADVGGYRALVNFAGRFHDLHTMARECKQWTDWIPEYFQAMAIRQPR
ncbi:hypothetical protein [Nannocystis punicea]|uniref:Uncharacterized protein n=1 Tax=Nannocystis punicea TaxID=2995304 RepID=A0ABY7H7U8_9BACT|nr:hypothetical protein [Nannocystis poenicansa]WAS95338.1 hypothetical protein O0S08_04190 [Nannocystis poenicansa]